MSALLFSKQHPQKEKGPTRVGPVLGIISPANRPDPDGPGGLGAEESGTEGTGSTQAFLFAAQRGARLAEVGQQYDSSNDPVTPDFRPYLTIRRCFRRVYKVLAGPGS